MKKTVLILGISAITCFIASGVFAEKPASTSLGKSEFAEHCAVCHPDGGNIINPKKSLHQKDREMNNIKTGADIVKLLRNPGPGMTLFDEKTITKKEAQAIAEYVLKTF